MHYRNSLLGLFFLSACSLCSAFDHILLQNLHMYANTPLELVRDLQEPILPLFKSYPRLQEIPYIPLAQLPTPLQEHPVLAKNIGVGHFFEKQDGKTGTNGRFGGNKVRKLSFLLAEAVQHRDKISAIMTFGCAGSNHALATAAYAQELGIPCVLLLKPQHPSHVVQRNLLMDLYYGAQIVPVTNNHERAHNAYKIFKEHKQCYNKLPYLIPTGGSCPLGVLGFVNAVFELKDQIDADLMPEPDRIYAPLGSAGTITGLLLGIKATGLKSTLYAITVEPEEHPGDFITTIQQLFNNTVTLLRSVDSSFPHLVFNEHDLAMRYQHCGEDYALFTPEGVEAMRTARQDTMYLDGVYTGKAFAGLIASLKEDTELVHDKTILFWNTFDSRSFSGLSGTQDHQNLPPEFHHYFTGPVQPLDIQATGT